jgi:methylthioribose-1-phosphate isomerase
MCVKAESLAALSAAKIYAELEKEAVAIHEEDKALCRGMGESGKGLIKDGMGVLTHCNAGSLAASELGTATAPMYLAYEAGVKFRVYADETRPLLQGAGLTN